MTDSDPDDRFRKAHDVAREVQRKLADAQASDEQAEQHADEQTEPQNRRQRGFRATVSELRGRFGKPRPKT